MKTISLLTCISILALAPMTAVAQGFKRKQEALVDQVKKSVDDGIRFLKQQQNADGSWNVGRGARFNYGGTCLAVLALLESGVKPNDPKVKRGLEKVRSLDFRETYVTALQTMVLVKAGQANDLEKVRSNVKWLINARLSDGQGGIRGWSYGSRGPSKGDGSNTQYALLGLWAGKDAGVKIPEKIWREIRQHYISTQYQDGSWSYHHNSRALGGKSMTMTTAGLCGLLIAGMDVKEGREKLGINSMTTNCGSYVDNLYVGRALNWLNTNFQKQVRGKIFYNLYGIERAGRLTGLRFFGNHDWYREGCEYLVQIQHNDGSWYEAGSHDSMPIVSTSFALRFLAKGRTPVLISRIVHGPWPRNPAKNDWNRDRNAVKHLTKFCSKELFKRVPLAWQNFDVMRAVRFHNPLGGGLTEDQINLVTSDLLQSPVVLISGHFDPSLRFTNNEMTILRRYVENGGFIVAEACCGSPDFDAGMKRFVQRLFPPRTYPNVSLQDLSPGHPIWKAHFPIKPGAFSLQGLQMGCKTVMVYAPEDMSCRWEANDPKDAGMRGEMAFRMGANIVAYATGLEPPRPRLSETALARKNVPPPKRGYLRAVQIRYSGDWQPARNAMSNLMDHMRNYAGLDVALKPETMRLYNPSITEYKFVYLHGRGDPKFDKLTDADLKFLRFNLKTGGLMLADACCGNKLFDAKFRAFVRKLFPDHKLAKIDHDDPLFGAKLNGEALTIGNIRYRKHPNLRVKGSGKMMNDHPYLEGIKIRGRWALLYSKYDIGCALERHQSSNCYGYDYPSAKRIAAAAVLHLMRP